MISRSKSCVHMQRNLCKNLTLLQLQVNDDTSKDVTLSLKVLSMTASFSCVLNLWQYGIHSLLPLRYVLKNTVFCTSHNSYFPAKHNDGIEQCLVACIMCGVHMTVSKHGIFFLCLKYANHRFHIYASNCARDWVKKHKLVESAHYFAANQTNRYAIQVVYYLEVEHCTFRASPYQWAPASSAWRPSSSHLCLWHSGTPVSSCSTSWSV